MDKVLKSLVLLKERKAQRKVAAKKLENLKLATKKPLKIKKYPRGEIIACDQQSSKKIYRDLLGLFLILK